MRDQRGQVRVLLVEDSELTIVQFLELLAALSPRIKLSIASRERAAIAMAKVKRPEIAILDLNLKEGSGYNVLRELKTHEPPPTVIIATNFALPQYRDLALLMGADYFIDKMKDIEVLPRLLNSIVEEHERMADAQQTIGPIRLPAQTKAGRASHKAS